VKVWTFQQAVEVPQKSNKNDAAICAHRVSVEEPKLAAINVTRMYVGNTAKLPFYAKNVKRNAHMKTISQIRTKFLEIPSHCSFFAFKMHLIHFFITFSK